MPFVEAPRRRHAPLVPHSVSHISFPRTIPRDRSSPAQECPLSRNTHRAWPWSRVGYRREAVEPGGTARWNRGPTARRPQVLTCSATMTRRMISRPSSQRSRVVPVLVQVPTLWRPRDCTDDGSHAATSSGQVGLHVGNPARCDNAPSRDFRLAFVRELGQYRNPQSSGRAALAR